MSARLVSNVSVNRLATFAKGLAVRGTDPFTVEGLAWAFWEANVGMVREHYGDRAEAMFPELRSMAQDFSYAPAYGSSLELSRDLRDLMTNSLSQDAEHRAAWRVLGRLTHWLRLYVRLEQAEVDRLPIPKRDARTIRLLARPRGGARTPQPLQPDDQLSLF
ncbi:hypothetical protein [Brevundimonas sp.]|uniref:hypothetical protein n=1 Tax=Brevundimonas sp. TaxID=1871086 RepID=UPI0028A2CA75|nr:hypothetical protein [Brevundimonas sp.]